MPERWGCAGVSQRLCPKQECPSTCREEGFLALWKGNSVLIVRIFPYSAAQLASHDTYKRVRGTDCPRQAFGFAAAQVP
jgi:hypothetical protein